MGRTCPLAASEMTPIGFRRITEAESNEPDSASNIMNDEHKCTGVLEIVIDVRLGCREIWQGAGFHHWRDGKILGESDFPDRWRSRGNNCARPLYIVLSLNRTQMASLNIKRF